MGKYALKNQNGTNNFFNKGDKPMNHFHQISIFDLPGFCNDNPDFCSYEANNKSFAEEPDCPDVFTCKNQNETNNISNTEDAPVNEYHQISLFELPEFYDDNCDLEPHGKEMRLITYWGILNWNWRF